MPTIALMNGHAFAGALMLAMMHDYRIMNPHRGFVCLNEVELGVPLRPPMSSIFRSKVSPQVYRTLVLEGKRFKVCAALQLSLCERRQRPGYHQPDAFPNICRRARLTLYRHSML